MADFELSNPYYIIAPRYTRTSGGVRVLYRLADLINKAGGSAFVFLWPHYNRDVSASPMDVAPYLYRSIVDYHFKNGLTPIVIYPEIVSVSKFDPPIRVRYILNYNELLFKNEPLELDHYLISFSEAIAKQITLDKPGTTLFLPVSDPIFFSPPKEPVKRSGAVFYAGKYKYLFKGTTFPVTDGLPEITRDQPDSQTPDQIRDLFRQSEYFYCYEDSALALEAILCGCPTVFLPNEHFKKPLGAKELNGLGFAWGDSPEQLLHAKNTVVQAREEHLKRVAEIQLKVKNFVLETQGLARDVEYTRPFADEFINKPGRFRLLIDLMILMKDFYKERGLAPTLKMIMKRLKSRRTTV